MKKCIIIIIILLFTIFISNIECYAKRYALVIGNGSYKNVPLNNPVNDANDIANTLQELDFDVSKMINASKQEIINSIRNFENKITFSDVALFYYSGHGLQVNGINYIIPIGSDISSENEVEFEAVALNRIMSKLEKARINIIILDACRDNPYKGFRSTEKGLAILTSKTEGTFIAYSTAPGKVAIDGTGRNSPYTKNLIEKIHTLDLEIEDVFKEVRKAVKQETNSKQIPWDSSSLTDDFIFAMSCVPKITEPKQEIEVETEYTYGQIKVETNEDGSVYLDNNYVCSISAGSIKTLKNVITGAHIVKVKTDDETKSKNIIVSKDRTAEVTFNFAKVDNFSKDTYDNMIFVKGGSFQMGSNNGDSDEKPIHTVTVSDFYIGKYEVTNREYIEFLNAKGVSSNGSYSGTEYIDMDDEDCAIGYRNGKFYFKGSSYANDEDCSVIEVTWYGADAYCKWKGGRLPTEAEWEYAARGGIKSNGYKYSGSNNCGDVAWYYNNSGSKTHPVGQKMPNELGIYDMSGNVWEWCSDWYYSNYYSKSPNSNPKGPTSGTYRVWRGGSWNDEASYYRVANRYYNFPGDSGYIFGFRFSRSVE